MLMVNWLFSLNYKRGNKLFYEKGFTGNIL